MSKNKSTKKKLITSKFVTKLLVRLFVILLLIGIVPIYLDEEVKKNLEVTYIYIANKWVFIFPIILFLSFLTLLILTGRAKHEQEDLNWMLALNTALLIIYLVMLYTKLYPSLYGEQAYGSIF